MNIQDFASAVSAVDASRDDNLSQYIVPTHAIATLQDLRNETYCGIGVKGVGKSAAFQFLTQQADDTLTVAIDPSRFEVQNFSEKRSCRAFIPIAETLIRACVLQEVCRQKNLMEKILPKSTFALFKEGLTIVQGYLGRISSLGGFGFSFRIEKKEDDGAIAFKELERDKNAQTLLDNIVNSIKIRVVIDDPDEFLYLNSSYDKDLIAAVTIAANNARQKLGRSFKCIILLKPNICHSLKQVDTFANLPLRFSNHLSWTNKELKNLVRARAKYAGLTLDDVVAPESAEAVWQYVFSTLRSGPRDLLRRFEIASKYNELPLNKASITRHDEEYADTIIDQIYGAYSAEFPRIDEFVRLCAEAISPEILSLELRDRLIATQAANDDWATLWRDTYSRLRDIRSFLFEFGSAAAIDDKGRRILPYEQEYFGLRHKRVAPLPCLKPILGAASKI